MACLDFNVSFIYRSRRSRYNQTAMVYWYGDWLCQWYSMAGVLYFDCLVVSKETAEEIEGTMVYWSTGTVNI